MAQDKICDLLGHAGEQFVALGCIHAVFSGHDIGHQDLDVHFMVGRIDTAGVINEIGIEAHTMQTEFNTGALRQGQVGPFANDGSANVGGIDAQGIIALVANLLEANSFNHTFLQ